MAVISDNSKQLCSRVTCTVKPVLCDLPKDP